MPLSRKHQGTQDAIFATPVRASIVWSDIEALFAACGAVFHRPHPRKETEKGAVKSVRRFLTKAGIVP